MSRLWLNYLVKSWKWCEPIVTWVCRVKSGARGRGIQYSAIDVHESSLSGKYRILQEYFVRNACVLFENLSSSLRELMEFLRVLYGIPKIVMVKFLILVLFQGVRYHM